MNKFLTNMQFYIDKLAVQFYNKPCNPKNERKIFMYSENLYDKSFEHDNCGIGAVVNIKGIKSHKTVEDALTIVETLEHRAGKDAEGKTGDGVGILLQISHKFFNGNTSSDFT